MSTNSPEATYYMGIDGGGSTLRVAIADQNMNIVHQIVASAVNPNVVGKVTAQQRIQTAILQAVTSADLAAEDIQGAGIGISGAPANVAHDWLIQTVHQVLPKTRVIPASDQHIALVGAHGKQEGVLVLAGTGSLAYGVTADGQSALVGGWGYRFDDEGSGYWIGSKAVTAILQAYDGRGPVTALREAVLTELGLFDEWALLDWSYTVAATRDIARLASIVLLIAEQGDAVALSIIENAAASLAEQAKLVIQRLRFENPDIAFTGGLIESPTLLSKQLCEHLGLQDHPQLKYPPVIGAVLLAREEIQRA